jgi:hypothetical protein
MPQKNIAHVIYSIENTDLSSMPNIVIFHVLYVISVNLTARGMDAISGPSVGPTRQWERENPLLPPRSRSSSLRLPTPDAFVGHRRCATGRAPPRLLQARRRASSAPAAAAAVRPCPTRVPARAVAATSQQLPTATQQVQLLALPVPQAAPTSSSAGAADATTGELRPGRRAPPGELCPDRRRRSAHLQEETHLDTNGGMNGAVGPA